MYINVLKPFHNGAASIWSWFEMVPCHCCISTQHIITVLREFVVFVVYESIGILSLFWIITPFLNLDEAVSLGNQWQIRFGNHEVLSKLI